MLDITLITCNYNTPDLIKTLLRSWTFHNIDVTDKCIVIDNSSNDETVPFLVENKIPHVINRCELHHRGVQVALDMVKTRYALLVDSDVVFNDKLYVELNWLIANEINLAGHVEGDRGGHLLFKRVHPWFCFIDMDFVNFYGIRFTDPVRIRKTNSSMFFQHVPDCKHYPQKRYDVGSTFLEDVMLHKGKVLNRDYSGKYFTHYEGMSWHKFSDHIKIEQCEKIEIEYKKDYDRYSSINLSEVFK